MTLDERREADLNIIAVDFAMRIRRGEGYSPLSDEVDNVLKDAEKILKFLTDDKIK